MMYSSEQITNMIQIYGKADGNHYDVRCMYKNFLLVKYLIRKYSFTNACEECYRKIENS